MFHLYVEARDPGLAVYVSPQLQFVTGLLDSPMTKAKGVVPARGLWYEMPSSLGLPFDVNQSLMFPNWS